jgi:hypothetical protein
MTQVTYSWFGAVTGDDLEQGDILDDCPVFRPPDKLPVDANSSAFFEAEARSVIVMSQSCDLVKGREKLSDVLLCPVWGISTFKPGHHLSTTKGREAARRGELPGIHLLAACDLPRLTREVSVVDFRQVYSLPIGFTRKQAAAPEQRLRLLPPYREHLAQAFARFFMRVGLPTDIPAFR